MKVTDIRVEHGPQHERPLRLAARIEVDTDWLADNPPFEVWYDYPVEAEAYIDPTNADPFLAAFLLPAMRLGEPLSLDGSISGRLNDAILPIQAMFSAWDDLYVRIPVETSVRAVTARGPQDRRGLFFSHGLDSSYCLAKNLRCHANDSDRMTHLITVEGFDIYLWERQRFPPLFEDVRRIAAEVAMSPMAVTTNLRDFSDRIVDWPTRYHGAALASVALALGDYFDSVVISATDTYADLRPFGSHPLADPMWSTESLTLRHDGVEATRLAKAQFLASEPRLLHGLRVCTTGEDTDAYNCGRCEKCIRTALELSFVGALEECPELPQLLDPSTVRSIEPTRFQLRHYRELLEHGRLVGADPELLAAIDMVVSR